MQLKRILVLTGDHRLADPTKWGRAYSSDDLELHRAMCDALAASGRWEIDVCNDHSQLLAQVVSGPPDLVLNFCDTGFENIATRELHVPALLELHGMRYTGSPPAALAIAYDKALVNILARSLDVPVPNEWLFDSDTPADAHPVSYPALVKPAQGDGSVGINRDAIVHSGDELDRQLRWFRRTFTDRAALVQEYLPGTEYGLALVGNPGSFRALPMLEVDYSQLSSDTPQILAFESKTGPANPYDKVSIRPARLAPEIVTQLAERAARLFRRIGCCDYARFDFRTAADGAIKLMEINPNPAWSCEAKLARMALFDGIAYPRLLEMLVDVAWTRVGGG